MDNGDPIYQPEKRMKPNPIKVPRKFDEGAGIDIELIVAELECHLYSESVTAGMGSAVSGEVIQLNRRGGGGSFDTASQRPFLDWKPISRHPAFVDETLDSPCDVSLRRKRKRWSLCYIHRSVGRYV